MNNITFGGNPSPLKLLIIETVAKLLDIVEVKTVSIEISVIQPRQIEGNDVAAAIFFPDDTETTAGLKHFQLGIGIDHDFSSLITSIAHEIVHIDQYTSGRLVKQKRVPFARKSDQDEEFCFWEGEAIETECASYYDLPWEVEAYELQDDLAQLLAQDAAWHCLVEETVKSL